MRNLKPVHWLFISMAAIFVVMFLLITVVKVSIEIFIYIFTAVVIIWGLAFAWVLFKMLKERKRH